MPGSRPLQEAAPAKVNLTLAIKGRLANGYHAIESLIAFASVGDSLTVTDPAGGQPGVGTLDGPFATALEGDSLVAKGAGLVARYAAGLKGVDPGLPALRLPTVRLTKRLPVAAGVGGGSADAAAYMRIVQRLNPHLSARLDWMRMALELGADVPACLMSQPLVARGIGERLETVRFSCGLPAILANPLVPVPATKTRDVFLQLRAPLVADLAAGTADRQFDSSRLRAEVQDGSNDLTEAATAVMPIIADVLRGLPRDDDGVFGER